MLIRGLMPQVAFAAEGAAGGSDSGGGAAAPAGGSSPSPSSTPSAASPSEPATPAAPATPAPGTTTTSPSNDKDSDVFEGFFGPSDDEVEGVDTPPSGQPSGTPPAPQPAEAPPATPSPQPPQPAQPQPAPQAQPSPAPGQQEASPPPTPAEPFNLVENLSQNEAALTEHLAQSMFTLSKEDLEALEADAPAFIPKLLARTYVKQSINMYRAMQEHVPAMVRQQVQAVRKSMENENKFWGSWPQLNRSKHDGLLKLYAPLYRQGNPQASMDQMIADLGPIIAAKAGVNLQAPPGAYPNPAVPNGQPVAFRTPQPQPFRPAMGGPAAPSQQVAENPWEGLGQDFSEQE